MDNLKTCSEVCKLQKEKYFLLIAKFPSDKKVQNVKHYTNYRLLSLKILLIYFMCPMYRLVNLIRTELMFGRER